MTAPADKTPRRKAAVLALAVALAAPAEGLRQWAYRDPVGILTVCYGHTGADIQAGRQYGLAECKQMLTADMAAAVDAVERCAPGLPEAVTGAFADAVFNMGPTIACDVQRSTAARMLRAGDIRGACNELPRWSKARVAGILVTLPGLAKRRSAERALCLAGVGGV